MIKSNDYKKELTRAQERVLPHLLICHSYEEASKAANVSCKQIFEWLKQPHFMEELKRQKNYILERTRHSLQMATDKAVQRLTELLDTDKESVQLRAAIAILDQSSKINDIANVEERLKRLEELSNE